MPVRWTKLNPGLLCFRFRFRFHFSFCGACISYAFCANTDVDSRFARTDLHDRAIDQGPCGFSFEPWKDVLGWVGGRARICAIDQDSWNRSPAARSAREHPYPVSWSLSQIPIPIHCPSQYQSPWADCNWTPSPASAASSSSSRNRAASPDKPYHPRSQPGGHSTRR